MSIEGILVGLLAIVIGAAWAFYGLKLFTILLPIWAFFFGLVMGAQWASDVFGQGFFSSVLSWGIGLVFGLVLAAISYFWYYAAIVILAGAAGYSLGVGFFEYFGFGTGVIAIVVAVTARTADQPRFMERPDASRLRSMLALAKWARLRLGSAIGAAYVTCSSRSSSVSPRRTWSCPA